MYNRVKAGDVKSCTYAAMSDARHYNMCRGMPWPQTCATHNQAQFGLPDKGLAIKR